MKLLIITQTVDRRDTMLGFFHNWLEEIAKGYESILVICLKEGEHDLPPNVRVLSLGKERGNSKIGYLWNFYKYIWSERQSYDSVFVHMNQEYVLLGWKSWLLLRKPIYMISEFIGLPASGKSTLARLLVSKKIIKRARIERSFSLLFWNAAFFINYPVRTFRLLVEVIRNSPSLRLFYYKFMLLSRQRRRTCN